MAKDGYFIREMARNEVDLAVSWAKDEGWNPGIHDAKTFYRTDPHGFFVGILDNQPVSCISAVAYGEFFGFLGFYIVKPSFRGRGLGIGIWKAGMKHLKGRNIGLDGVLEQQKLYERIGFKQCCRSVRYQGVGTGAGCDEAGIKDLAQLPIVDLLAYDDQFFPASRHVFIKSWILQPEGAALGLLIDDELAGYGVLRKCYQGYKIGPLFADSPEIANSLFCALCGHASEGSQVFLDVPEPNSTALELAKRHKMLPVFETVRMYNKDAPLLPMNRIFGVTSFELG